MASVLVIFLEVQIGDLVFFQGFLEQEQNFENVWYFGGQPDAGSDPRLYVIPIRLQTVKS